MSTPLYLTLEEVILRCRNQVSEGTLRNRQSYRIGPSLIKIGKAILYIQFRSWTVGTGQTSFHANERDLIRFKPPTSGSQKLSRFPTFTVASFSEAAK